MAHNDKPTRFPVPPVIPSPQDFWRDQTGALPNGASDVTENIGRLGLTGFNISVPLHHADIAGSLGLNGVATGSLSYTVQDSDTIIYLLPNILQTVVYVGALTPRRLLVIVNQSVTQKVIPSHLDELGVAQTVIRSYETVALHSVGGVWRVAWRSRPTALQVVARGVINLGDPTPLGARPVTDSFNIASATGLDGPLATSRVSVVFSAPVQSLSYRVSGSLELAGPYTAAQINLSWMVVSKSLTGFVFATRESTSVAQNVNFNFDCVRYP